MFRLCVAARVSCVFSFRLHYVCVVESMGYAPKPSVSVCLGLGEAAREGRAECRVKAARVGGVGDCGVLAVPARRPVALLLLPLLPRSAVNPHIHIPTIKTNSTRALSLQTDGS